MKKIRVPLNRKHQKLPKQALGHLWMHLGRDSLHGGAPNVSKSSRLGVWSSLTRTVKEKTAEPWASPGSPRDVLASLGEPGDWNEHNLFIEMSFKKWLMPT